MNDYQMKIRDELIKKTSFAENRMKWYFEKFGVHYIQRPILDIIGEKGEQTTKYIFPNFKISEKYYVFIEENNDVWESKKKKLKSTTNLLIRLKPSTITNPIEIINKLENIFGKLENDSNNIKFALSSLRSIYNKFIN